MVLFIGNFLSKHKGTINPSEKIYQYFKNERKINIKGASKFLNKYLRLLDMAYKTAITDYSKLHIDVFSGNAFMFANITSKIGYLRKKKIILNLHGGGLPNFTELRKKQVEDVLSRASIILTPSKTIQKYYQNLGYKIDYLPNSLSLTNFPFKHIRTTKPKLLWVRAFSEIYNPDLPIKLIFELKKTIPNISLTMIGPDKGLLASCKNLIKELDVDENITIIGPVKNENLTTFYHNHTIYLNTPSLESFGISVMEAAACGIPVISSPVGEIPTLWRNGVDIILTDNLSVSSFLTKTIQLFKDHNLQSTLAINARNNAEKYSWEKIKKHWIDLIE